MPCRPCHYIPDPVSTEPLQDEMRLQTTQCDNCIIGTMIALQVCRCAWLGLKGDSVWPLLAGSWT
jgi:predicted small integral membrane protein